MLEGTKNQPTHQVFFWNSGSINGTVEAFRIKNPPPKVSKKLEDRVDGGIFLGGGNDGAISPQMKKLWAGGGGFFLHNHILSSRIGKSNPLSELSPN